MDIREFERWQEITAGSRILQEAGLGAPVRHIQM